MDKDALIRGIETASKSVAEHKNELNQDFDKRLTRISNSIAFYLDGGLSPHEAIDLIDKEMLEVRKTQRHLDDARMILIKHDSMLNILKEEKK